jgi:hypothetical protein
MGYDVRIEGQLTIPADKVEAAARALFAKAIELGKWDWSDDHTDKEGNRWGPAYDQDALKNGINESLSDGCFYFWPVDDGSMIIEPSEDYVRREEEDEWIFHALASFIDDGELDLTGEDGYQWQWRIRGDEFHSVGGTTVYGNDAKAPDVLEEIIKVIYRPADHALSPNQPVTALFDYADPEYEQVVVKIENIIREAGFGPQAGLSELERVAEV